MSTDAYREHPVWSYPGIEAYVKQQWLAGMPTREIANEVFRRTRTRCSPDMVASKAKRMGLPRRNNPIGHNGQQTKPGVIQRRTKTRGWRHEPPDAATGRVSECMWPLNDARPWKFCGCPTLPGKPYCYEHTQLSLPESKRDKPVVDQNQ